MNENQELETLRSLLARVCTRHMTPEAATYVERHARPSIRLRHTDASVRSHLGGTALLEDPAMWPWWQDRPLSLVAVIDLAELAHLESDPLLPPNGVLNFFYDTREQPWGYEPEHGGGSRVVLADSLSAQPVSAPEGAEAFLSIGLAPYQSLSIPGWEESPIGKLFAAHTEDGPEAEEAWQSYESVEAEWGILSNLARIPDHQIGGWPRLIQRPFWEECELASRGLSYDSPERERMINHAIDFTPEDDWQLLLQLDADASLGWTWGDCGTLYFAIRKSLALPEAVQECWLTLQCS